jgi:uncharacterized protein YdbL (DUF1318 family)
MKKYLAIVAIALVAACGTEDKPAEEAKKDQPLSQSKNDSRFNDSFNKLLNSYFHLKDALVLSNDSMAISSAKLLSASADSLPLNELKADSSITLTAKDYLSSISSEAKALTNEADLEAKRKSFQMISENLYTLLQTVRYDQAVVYHQFCPMAFNDAGAFWLSESADIKNPYYGKKMLTCGEVKDSIDFRGQ